MASVAAYQVIYVRTVEANLEGGETLQTPVYGPGSMVKVYVRAVAPDTMPVHARR